MKVKSTGRASSMVFGVMTGVLVSLVVTLASAAVIAVLVSTGRMTELSIGYCGYLVVPVSVMLGTLAACWMVKRRRLLVGVLVACGYYCVLLGLACSFFGGVHQGAILTGAMALIGGTSVGVAGMKRGGAGQFDGRKYRPR